MRQLLLLALTLGAASCGEVDGATNPSDAAQVGTAVAVLNTIDEDVTGGATNLTPGPSSSNSTTNNAIPQNPNGTQPWDLDCTGSLTVSGARSFSGLQANGCSGANSGTEQSIGFWFDNLDRGLTIGGFTMRQAGDLAPFQATVRLLLDEDPSTDEELSWVATCTVNLTSSVGYSNPDGEGYAVWTGSLACPAPAQPFRRAETLADWEDAPAEGELVFESFVFETPFPSG